MNSFISLNSKIYILCALSLSILIFLGSYKFAGLLLTFYIFSGIIYTFFKKVETIFMVSWLIGFSPFIILLRQFIISYSGFTILLILITFLIILFSPSIFRFSYKNKILFSVFVFFSLFVLFGILQGNNYLFFMKYIEMILSIMLIVPLLNYDLHKINAFRNMVFGTIFMWLVLAKDISSRFELVTSQGFSIGGDPSSLAIFLVFSLILILFNDGKDLNWIENSKLRIFLSILLISLLFISTSRTNMSIILVLLLFFALNNTKGFLKYIFIFIPLFILIYLNSSVEFTDEINKFFIDKLFNEDRTLNQLTTKRFDQWLISLYYAFNENFLQVLIGYGPGNINFLYEYSHKYQSYLDIQTFGKNFPIHTFYMTVLVEYGLIAFILFIFFILKVLFYNLKLYFFKGIDLPLYFTITYLMTIFGNLGASITGGIMASFSIYYFSKKNSLLFKEN